MKKGTRMKICVQIGMIVMLAYANGERGNENEGGRGGIRRKVDYEGKEGWGEIGRESSTEIARSKETRGTSREQWRKGMSESESAKEWMRGNVSGTQEKQVGKGFRDTGGKQGRKEEVNFPSRNKASQGRRKMKVKKYEGKEEKRKRKRTRCRRCGKLVSIGLEIPRCRCTPAPGFAPVGFHEKDGERTTREGERKERKKRKESAEDKKTTTDRRPTMDVDRYPQTRYDPDRYAAGLTAGALHGQKIPTERPTERPNRTSQQNDKIDDQKGNTMKKRALFEGHKNEIEIENGKKMKKRRM